MKPKVVGALAEYGNPAVDAFFNRRDEQRRRSEQIPTSYPGDYDGLPTLTFDPHPGDLPDPGEVVWAFIPFEDDRHVGKDRPTLVIGREAGTKWLVGLPLSSVDHDADLRQEAKQHRYWENIGRGVWDAKGRESFVRLDRIVRVDPLRVRRIGGAVTEDVFWAIAASLRRNRGK